MKPTFGVCAIFEVNFCFISPTNDKCWEIVFNGSRCVVSILFRKTIKNFILTYLLNYNC